MRRRCSTAPQHRPGFTLIELLVVIVILALLIGLLVPAVMRAVVRAKEAATAAEIQALSQALADFKSKYNEYPPSKILICENGDYSTATISSAPASLLVSRSVAALKRYWPRLSLNTSSAAGAAPGVTSSNFYDVNGNNTADAPYILTGPECLVLFLGGIPQSTGGGWSMTGFSKNPANPFQGTSVTTNRTVPLYEFNNGRLVTNTQNLQAPPGGFPGYIDNLGSPAEATVIPFYVYFSAYGGAGYDPSDCDMNEPDSASGTSPIQGAFVSSNSPTSTKFSGNILASPAPNPYTSSAPVPTDSSGKLNTGTSPVPQPRAWVNANSFQLFSAGNDRLFGIGGQYISQSNSGIAGASTAQGTTKLPFVDMTTSPPPPYTADSLQTNVANATVTKGSLGNDIRFREADNVSNFASGRLD